MHPREHKYKHAAMFPIRSGGNGVVAEAALVCNFGKDLLDHDDVVLMFHELGHVMHHVLGQQRWSMQSGIATESDFAEAPSMMFEEWAWSFDTLSRFAVHAETGAPIPRPLVEAMQRARRFGTGLWTVQQLFYAAISLELHRQSPRSDAQLALVQQLQAKYTPFAHVEGTRVHTSFGHLVEYSSMYYTYLWSHVIAKDLLTAFKGNLLDRATARRYRDRVLVPGGTKPAAALVADFLGRPYDVTAYAKYLAGP
jgi:thimet oligopeptidase